MSLLDRLDSKSHDDGRQKCAVALLYSSAQDSTTLAEFTTAIDGKDEASKRFLYDASKVAAVLREDGHEVSAFSVRRHRRRECAC